MVHVVTNNNSEVTSVLVRFDNSRVGLKAIQTSQYRSTAPHAVPLSKYDIVFFLPTGSEDLKSSVCSSH